MSEEYQNLNNFPTLPRGRLPSPINKEDPSFLDSIILNQFGTNDDDPWFFDKNIDLGSPPLLESSLKFLDDAPSFKDATGSYSNNYTNTKKQATAKPKSITKVKIKEEPKLVTARDKKVTTKREDKKRGEEDVSKPASASDDKAQTQTKNKFQKLPGKQGNKQAEYNEGADVKGNRNRQKKHNNDDDDDEDGNDDDNEDYGDSSSDESSGGGGVGSESSSKRKKPMGASGSSRNTSSAKEKNREHAKNTRIRKKHYIESLKSRIMQLQQEREEEDIERTMILRKMADKVLARKKVLQTFFFLRATGERSRMKWESIVEPSFNMVMPITPYRSFPPHEVCQGQRHLRDLSSVIMDTVSQHIMIQSIAPRVVGEGEEGKIAVQYYSGSNESVVADDAYMCKWQMFTTNAVQWGARYEVAKVGMVKALFSERNILQHLELAFDAMSFMQQLRRATGSPEYMLVPNTIQLAVDVSYEARVITERSPPYKIIHANPVFQELFECHSSQLVGEPMSMLATDGQEGSIGTDQNRLDDFNSMIKETAFPSAMRLMLFTAVGHQMRLVMRAYPLYTNGVVTHFLRVVDQVFYPLPLMLPIPTSQMEDYQQREQRLQFPTAAAVRVLPPNNANDSILKGPVQSKRDTSRDVLMQCQGQYSQSVTAPLGTLGTGVDNPLDVRSFPMEMRGSSGRGSGSGDHSDSDGGGRYTSGRGEERDGPQSLVRTRRTRACGGNTSPRGKCLRKGFNKYKFK